MNQISRQGMIHEARDLLEPGEEERNIEYVRGMCELIARCFPIADSDTADNALFTAQEITGRVIELYP